MSEGSSAIAIQEKINETLSRLKKNWSDIKVVAVSKAQSNKSIESFLEEKFSYWALGESYLPELVEKQKHFTLLDWSKWHFIGQLQSRKIPEILSRVDVLHSVCREKELLLIAQKPKPFFVQVNVSGESSKSGLLPEAVEKFLEKIASHNLNSFCLGLMTMPSPLEDCGESQLRKEFTILRELKDRFLPSGLLNMGTSSDYVIALEEGADVLRLGSVLFGERKY